MNGNITTRSNEDILNTNLWYNPKISNLFFPNWYKNSIISISDIVNEIGEFLPQEQLQFKFSNLKYNFLEYYRLKIAVSSFITCNKKGNGFKAV